MYIHPPPRESKGFFTFKSQDHFWTWSSSALFYFSGEKLSSEIFTQAPQTGKPQWRLRCKKWWDRFINIYIYHSISSKFLIWVIMLERFPYWHHLGWGSLSRSFNWIHNASLCFPGHFFGCKRGTIQWSKLFVKWLINSSRFKSWVRMMTCRPAKIFWDHVLRLPVRSKGEKTIPRLISHATQRSCTTFESQRG